MSEPPPSKDELEQALSAELLDKDGKQLTFGDLVRCRRVVVIFVRHFCELAP